MCLSQSCLELENDQKWDITVYVLGLQYIFEGPTRLRPGTHRVKPYKSQTFKFKVFIFDRQNGMVHRCVQNNKFVILGIIVRIS